MAQIPSRPRREGLNWEFQGQFGGEEISVPTRSRDSWERQGLSGGLAVTVPEYVPAKRMSPRWRSRLRIAAFKSQPFYVDQQGRSSGRRTVVHEYPKRDMPYTEDMGRIAMRYQITGYLVQAPRNPQGQGADHEMYHGMFRDYDIARDNLERVLCEPSPGVLMDPYNPGFILQGYSSQPLFMCERYTIVEQRERGGFCSLEMSFVEAGAAAGAGAPTDTVSVVMAAANHSMGAAVMQLDGSLPYLNQPSANLSEMLTQMMPSAPAGGYTGPGGIFPIP